MPTPRGRRLVGWSAVGAFAVLVVGGITMRERIREQWWLREIDAEDTDVRFRAILAAGRTDRSKLGRGPLVLLNSRSTSLGPTWKSGYDEQACGGQRLSSFSSS